jgi:hypothetical protein
MFSRVFGLGAFLKLPVLGAVRLFLSSCALKLWSPE